MKIVIDINEHLYKTIKTLGLVVEDGDAVAVSEAIRNGTPLPENATNRDVINSIFGKYFSIPLATTEEWLDAPYEEGNNDNEICN